MKIIIGNNEVWIGDNHYHSFNNREQLFAMVHRVIEGVIEVSKSEDEIIQLTNDIAEALKGIGD